MQPPDEYPLLSIKISHFRLLGNNAQEADDKLAENNLFHNQYGSNEK